MRKIIVLFVSIFLVLGLSAQTGKVSSKSGVKKGILPNGMTYYIYRNSIYDDERMQGNGSANFYIMQNVGAILEEDSQNGLAHFLEHMAFNGTKNFPGNAIMEAFETKSLKSNINAYTHLDETIYHFTDIPTKDMSFCDKCLLILHDWTDYLTLDSLAIENERPVILEEMRLRNTVNSRIQEQMIPITLNFSKYGNRNIVGPAENIKNFKKEELYKFYHDWYRSDLQAIVVIGDVNVEETESKIKGLFSTVKPIKNPKERYHVVVPDNKKILYKQIKDNQINTGSVNIEYRHKINFNIKESLYHNLINSLIAARVNKMLKDDTLNFMSASISYYPLVYNYNSYKINFSYKKGRDKLALKKLFGLHKDILKNGFTEKEYIKIKEVFLKSLKEEKEYCKYQSNSYYFDKIKTNFINNTDILHPTETLELFNELIRDLSLEDITRKINQLYSGPNKSIIVIGNTNDNLLSKSQIDSIELVAKPVAYIPDFEKEKKKEKDIEFVKEELKSVKVKNTETLKLYNAKKWELENGATVIYKQCDINPNYINLYATSYGGTSVFDKSEDILHGIFFNDFQGAFGIKDIDVKELEDYMRENRMDCSVGLTLNKEEISVSGFYRNVENMFQLLYCIFEKPEFCKTRFNNTITSNINKLRSIPTSFKSSLGDSLNIFRYGKKRTVSFGEKTFNSLSFEKIKDVYLDRIKDASNFTFYIVGGIGEKKAKKLAQQYIGNISSVHTNEKYKTLNNPFPKGYNYKELKFDMEIPKAGVYYYINKAQDYSFKKHLMYNIMNMFLRDKIQKVIRQLERGTYNVSVNNYYEVNALNNCGFLINFECNPERVKDLNKTLNIAIDVIKEKGISEADFKILKDMIKPPMNIPRNNASYINSIKDYIESGVDRSESDYFIKQHENLKYEEFNKELIEFLSNADILDIIYLPKN